MNPFIKKYRIDILVLLSGAIIYGLSVAAYGSGITNDSINYLSAAVSFPEHLLKVDGSPYVEWPPLYPILLSIFKLTGMTPTGFACLLNGIVFSLNLWIAGMLLKTSIQSKYIYYISIAFLIFSVPLLQSHVFIWSEPIFILLMQLSILALLRYLESERFIYFICLIFFSMLMSLQRKTGLYFTLSFGICLFALSEKKSILNKTTISIIYVVISAIPFTLWTYRKYLVAGRVFESAFMKGDKIFDNVSEMANTLSSWFMPRELPLPIRIIFIIFFLLFLLYQFRNYIFLRTLFNSRLIKICFISSLSYFILLPITFIYIHGETIDDRILSPVIMPFIMFTFLFIDNIISKVPDIDISKKGLLIVLILSLCYPVMRTCLHIKKWNTLGTGGYNTNTLLKSDLINWIQTHNSAITICTNNEYILNYILNYRTNQHREIVNINRAKNINRRFLLVLFETSVNKDSDFNYIGKEKILFKNSEGLAILIDK